MSSAISLSISDMLGNAQGEYHHLADALSHYKRRAEWLLQVNALHGRFAGALDLASMIEAYSVWLMPLADHDLLAYHNPGRGRSHSICSGHGPERRQLLLAAESLFASLAAGQEIGSRHEGLHLERYEVDYRGERGFLLLLRQARRFEPEEARLVEGTLEILKENLQRALDYEDIYEQARRDTLTGLANRRVLEERLKPIMESARRHHHALTLASMDLDHFKEINDTFGHAKGDEVLRQVAGILAGMIRQSDLLVRMGGDEFVLVLPNTDLQAAGILVNRLTMAVEQLEITISGAQKLGISIGLSQWDPDFSQDEWLQRADENLYQVKAGRRNRPVPC